MMNTEKSIKWYTQKELAETLGISVNTFKEQFRHKFPPNRQNGQRLYWSSRYVNEIVQQLEQQPATA